MSPNPNCPLAFSPHVHTVPFPFNATKWLYPPTTFACVVFPTPFTFTFTAAHKSFFSLYIFMYVVPKLCAVTTPVLLSTVAILSSIDLNVHSSPGTSSINKLNAIVILYFICFVFPFSSKFIIFSSTFIFFLLMHHGVTKFSTVPFPISPFPLNPTVYTIPSWSAIAPV